MHQSPHEWMKLLGRTIRREHACNNISEGAPPRVLRSTWNGDNACGKWREGAPTPRGVSAPLLAQTKIRKELEKGRETDNLDIKN